ncbi:RNA-binding protein [Tubulinosema ratisbonensis]|uniref:RNA-binding protein n=1 Tax=Tubulinosema ratisbonensis TaxID=291195 RepID=A0A437ALU2_9MICR|nr:RNA-binding protein [Tubulinosema ratisbonensis]
MNKLIIKDLPKEVSEEILYELLNQVSSSFSIKLNNSICKITYSSEQECNYVYNVLNNIKLYNKHITIYKVKMINEIVILLQNIYKEINEIDVYKVCGNDCLVRIVREDGKSKRICFITCYDKKEGERILKLSFKHLGENVIVVYANNK